MRVFITAFLFLVMTFAVTSCTKVPAGTAGIKFYLLGGDKGVDFTPLEPGRYWEGFNEEIYIFPTTVQNKVWTKASDESPVNESFEFQSKEGLGFKANIGMSYVIAADDVPKVFSTYKRGIDEITNVFLRNEIRDALNKAGSVREAAFIYGEGKEDLMAHVYDLVVKSIAGKGITVEKIYLIGKLEPPTSIENAINAKLEATQKAQQRENELREAEAVARKVEAQAEGEANSILTRAKAQAEANRILSASITPTLIEYEKVQKWNGQNSQVVTGSGSGLMLNLGK